MSDAHSMFTATTIGIAAVRLAFKLANVQWTVLIRKEDGSASNVAVWEYHRANKAESASCEDQEVPLQDLDGMRLHASYTL